MHCTPICRACYKPFEPLNSNLGTFAGCVQVQAVGLSFLTGITGRRQLSPHLIDADHHP